MKIYSFEKLTVWQKARKLSVIIYKTTHQFPKDKARFTEIAYGSALELLNQTIISNDLGFINQDGFTAIRNEIDEITAMLDALYKSQLKLNS